MSEWQDISTAPQGVMLLLYFPEETGRNSLPEMVRADRLPVTYPRKPSHWMKIPAAPSPSQRTAE